MSEKPDWLTRIMLDDAKRDVFIQELLAHAEEWGWCEKTGEVTIGRNGELQPLYRDTGNREVPKKKAPSDPSD